MAQIQKGQFIGKYQIIEELGRGSRAVVYKAWQPTMERYVALKVLTRYDPQTLQRFQAEAQLTANLNHPYIRQVFEADRTPEGYIYVAMQYADTSLKALLQHRRREKRPFSPREVAHLLRPIAKVLDYIHSRGVVHLDIKPENILIFKGGRTVLADFGIAQRQGTHTHAGTPLYMSPEQAAGDRPVGPWSDICLLYTSPSPRD